MHSQKDGTEASLTPSHQLSFQLQCFNCLGIDYTNCSSFANKLFVQSRMIQEFSCSAVCKSHCLILRSVCHVPCYDISQNIFWDARERMSSNFIFEWTIPLNPHACFKTTEKKAINLESHICRIWSQKKGSLLLIQMLTWSITSSERQATPRREGLCYKDRWGIEDGASILTLHAVSEDFVCMFLACW